MPGSQQPDDQILNNPEQIAEQEAIEVYAELPDEFHTCQMWQGFKNPLLVINRKKIKNLQLKLNILKKMVRILSNLISSIDRIYILEL